LTGGQKSQSLLTSSPTSKENLSPILPLIVGEETKAVSISSVLRERGLFVPAIRYPTVARSAARLRITVAATHTAEDVLQLTAALSQIVNRKS
jgi:7-keto-8-aminopelargonate synthetase-like enzyme